MKTPGNLFARLSLLLLFLPITSMAQDDFDDPFDDINAEWDAFALDAAREFEEFRAQANAEYAAFLEEAWQQFEAMRGRPRPQDQNRLPLDVINSATLLTPSQAVKSKTTNARFNIKSAFNGVFESMRPDPSFKHKSVRKLLKEERRQRREAERLAEKQEKQRQKQQRADAERQKQLAQQNQQQANDIASSETNPRLVNFLFYGTPMQVNVGDIRKPLKLKSVNPHDVADAWRICSGSEYNELQCDLMDLREKYNLCDWAYLQMLSEAAQAYLGQGSNEATFLTAFIYCQSGYRIRLGQTGGRLIMLYACQNIIYDQDFFQLDGNMFYVFGTMPENLYLNACKQGFEKEQSLSLFVDKEPALAANNSDTRTIKSVVYSDMQIKVSVNQNLIKFYENYPTSNVDGNHLTRWALYANKPMDESVRQQIYPTLQEKIKGLSEYDAVCRLLSLLQSGLEYRYDEQVWGHDRAFFPEETLYYPYADCEDRAILFSRLVRDLLGLKVALIYYNASEAHLATAVHFNEKIKGDAFVINGENYFVCDPTNCIPAPGVTMQQEVNAQAQYILLN